MKGRKTLSLLAAAVMVLIFLAADASGNEYYVPSESYPTIQSAIDAAYANGGGTVHVAAVYDSSLESFPLSMKDGVQLIGAGAGVCILDAGGASVPVIDCTGISDPQTRIEGFTIQGSYNP